MDNAALGEMWRKYRGCALQARTIRGDLDRWRLRVLVLTAVGAVLATLAAQLPNLTAQFADLLRYPKRELANLARLLSAASAVTIELASYFGCSILGSTNERQWLRARALAESCKSESYRCAKQVPPYDDTNAGQRLLDKLQQLLASSAAIPASTASPSGLAIGWSAFSIASSSFAASLPATKSAPKIISPCSTSLLSYFGGSPLQTRPNIKLAAEPLGGTCREHVSLIAAVPRHPGRSSLDAGCRASLRVHRVGDPHGRKCRVRESSVLEMTGCASGTGRSNHVA
jgi:SMODS and SLOG-associating 2TM effector domain 3